MSYNKKLFAQNYHGPYSKKAWDYTDVNKNPKIWVAFRNWMWKNANKHQPFNCDCFNY